MVILPQEKDTEAKYVEVKPFTNHMNCIVPKTNYKKLTRLLHIAYSSPNVHSYVQAIGRDQHATWPHLSTKSFTKHLHETTETVLGYLDYERKKLSTKKIVQSSSEVKMDLRPEPTAKNATMSTCQCVKTLTESKVTKLDGSL